LKRPTEEEQRQARELNRRDFLIRVGCASAAALAAGGLGWALYDSQGPAPAKVQKALTGLGDYTLRAESPGPANMAIIRGADRAAMFQQGIKALGGMESFIQKGDRVLIKVNAAFATPASLGATTASRRRWAAGAMGVKSRAAAASSVTWPGWSQPMTTRLTD